MLKDFTDILIDMRMFERSTELPFMLSELRYISLMTDIFYCDFVYSFLFYST